MMKIRRMMGGNIKIHSKGASPWKNFAVLNVNLIRRILRFLKSTYKVGKASKKLAFDEKASGRLGYML